MSRFLVKTGTILTILFAGVPVFATTYESFTPTTDDTYTINATNFLGQTFTATADHTITSLDIKFGAGSGNVDVHITNTNGTTPTTDIVVVSNINVTGITNIPISGCYALTNGTKYGYWINYNTGSPTLDAINAGGYTDGDFVVGSSISPPNETRTRDGYFIIYGEAGGCSSPETPVNLGSTTIASTTLQLVGSTTIGLGIIIVIGSLGIITYMYNSMTKRKIWQPS